MRILFEGPILTQSGYGEHARLAYRALKLNKKNKIYVNPTRWGNTTWKTEDTPETREIESDIQSLGTFHRHHQEANKEMRFDLHVYVGLISEFEPRSDKTVLVTAGIETDKVSKDWLMRTYQRAPGKIFVPSEHAASSFVNAVHDIAREGNTPSKLHYNTDCKIEIVPYPIKKIVPKHLDFSMDTDFNFLSISLLGHRKNTESLVRWFLEEFKDDNVGLLLKTATANGSIIDREHTTKYLTNLIEKDEKRKCKVYLLHGDLSEEEVHSLYKRDDIHAYVTATRGEGYGLPIFEAAYSGVPVVATDWSGHLDFLQAPFREAGKTRIKKLFAKVNYKLEKIDPKHAWGDILITDSKWANPLEPSLKRQMRNVFKSHGRYKKWASKLQEHLLVYYKEEDVLERMNEALTDTPLLPVENREPRIEMSGQL